MVLYIVDILFYKCRLIENIKFNFVIFLILEMLLLEIFDRDGKRVIMIVYFGLNLDLFREGVEV